MVCIHNRSLNKDKPEWVNSILFGINLGEKGDSKIRYEDGIILGTIYESCNGDIVGADDGSLDGEVFGRIYGILLGVNINEIDGYVIKSENVIIIIRVDRLLMMLSMILIMNH